MATFHASDMTAHGRCAAEYGFRRAGLPQKTNSGTAYGVIMHLAMQRFELSVAEGMSIEEATALAIDTFLHYWDPSHIEAVTDPVPADGWLPNRSYGQLRSKGPTVLQAYAKYHQQRHVDNQLLALEFSFAVPVDGTWDEELGEPHVLRGTMDRLSIQRFNRIPALQDEDFKTGHSTPKYLRHHTQPTSYSYASTKPEFWTGWLGEDGFGEERGMDLYEKCKPMGRYNIWIDLHNMKPHSAGWRGPKDYRRLALAIEQIAFSVGVENYPMNISGATCQFCAYRATCGGGLPEDLHGAPGH